MESQHTVHSRAPTIFLSFTGLMEPLGQSQVLPYLEGLSKYFKVTVVSLEKYADLIDSREVDRLRERCEASGITWLHTRFRHEPRLLSSAVNLLSLLSVAMRSVRFRRPRLLHARSLLPAIVGMSLAKTLRIPLVFDMRGFWLEEQVTAGRLARGKAVHRILAAAENFCLRESAALVTLTKESLHHGNSPLVLSGTVRKAAVIPTCVDLDKFPQKQNEKVGPVVHGCVGTVLSGWYRIDWLTTWIRTVSTEDETALFEIVTKDDPRTVLNKLELPSHLLPRVSIFGKKSHEIPAVIRRHDLSLLFYAGGQLSEVARSPTRMAELLATGVPVVATGGVGDMEEIISQHNIGVILEGGNQNQMRDAFEKLNILLTDPLLSQRCRETARELFSLQTGVRRYAEVYDAVIATENRASTAASTQHNQF